jgi:hypothetical protein
MRRVMLGSAVLVIALTSATGALAAARQGHWARRQHRECTVGQCCGGAQCGGACFISAPCLEGPCPGAIEPGQCEQSADGGCECVPFPTPTPGEQGTPTATPVPQCSGATCGGPCALPFPCSPGEACPPLVQLGQCQLSATGNCDCLPAGTATPTATPVPQCSGATCGGECIISLPCGEPCLKMPAMQGQCTVSFTGSCDCVPLSTPTPVATPAPQCSGTDCGGPCLLKWSPFPCPKGARCPEIAVRSGQCGLSTSGTCECLPLPTPTQQPEEMPTPQCGGPNCGGLCVVRVSSCPPGVACPDVLVKGECEPTATGGCTCVPPTAPPTPTPQCNAAACGGPCLIAAPCASDLPCPELPVQPGQCTLDSVGGCECVPLSTPTSHSKSTPTPQCGGAVCAGPCVIPFPCPTDALCPGIELQLGQCEQSSAGGCDCVPASTPTPIPSQCSLTACSGPCVIKLCPPDALCPELLGHCEATAADSCDCIPGRAQATP